jgi:hypothetical protein
MWFGYECGSILSERTVPGSEISTTVRCEDCERTYAATISNVSTFEGRTE